MTGKAEQKSFEAPDETRGFDYGALDLLQIGGAEIGRLTLQPGWRWSEHVKPLAGTELCEAPHFQYHVSGTLHVVMADGAEFDAETFIAFLAEQPDLGPKQWPSFVRVGAELPRTETFKVIKRQLSAEGTECADPVWPIAR